MKYTEDELKELEGRIWVYIQDWLKLPRWGFVSLFRGKSPRCKYILKMEVEGGKRYKSIGKRLCEELGVKRFDYNIRDKRYTLKFTENELNELDTLFKIMGVEQ